MSEKASGNTGLPSVASMGSGGQLSSADLTRMASANSGPAITNVSEDTPIPLDDSVDVPSQTPAAPAQDTSAPAQDTTPALAKPAAAADPVEDLLKLPDDIPPAQDDPAPAAQDNQQPQTPAAPAQNNSRNYAEFPEELHPVLKSLNNANYAKFAPKLKELYTEAQRAKQLESDLTEARKGPQYFYEHPEGFRLSPEYRQTESQLSMADFELEHWRNQLIAIKSGQPWSELQGYKTDANGNPIEPVFRVHQPLGEGKIDNAAEVQVMQLLQQTGVARQQVANRAQSIAGVYAQSGERARSEIAEIDKRLFSKLGDVAKLPEADKKSYDLARSAVPRYFQGHPLVDMLGKAFVMYNRLLQRTITAQTEVERLRAAAAGKAAALPTRIPPGGGNGKPSKDDAEIKIDEL